MVWSIEEAVIMSLITSGGTVIFDDMTYLLKSSDLFEKTSDQSSSFTYTSLSTDICSCFPNVAMQDILCLQHVNKLDVIYLELLSIREHAD